MAGWEEELAILLHELGVKQEEPQTPLWQRGRPYPQPDDNRKQDHIADVLSWRLEQTTGEDADIDDEIEEAWVNDLNSMRQEVDAIVNQVVLLMQRGGLDSSIKEDIMVVLRALRRRALQQHQLTSNDEASYLESATAMLHFCRLVLQLSEQATEHD
ncbi:hypothetical protein [Ktedonobacter racemifer]|uniref:Uncharacterized protein n=1 Tax=Ktedonobacter racemifer DSM 44963 TaxID=485913 RepID=D6TH72_KTERA|nr:hypothetical protein [Ktedonobacter racemifer]EFH90814.1 hypothetical protein Krac_12455 [Ktedonobacter racemifer DSM 44963]